LPTGDGTVAGEFLVSTDGLTVTDTITGLVWQRGGKGARAGCGGKDNLSCTWAEAKAYCASLTLAGASDWGLPTLPELETIVDFTKPGPSIDRAAFPDTPPDRVWASFLSGRDRAWLVDFIDGASYPDSRREGYLVRCVRSRTCNAGPRFVVLPGGLVRDTRTSLTWQQRASIASLAWTDAKDYCASAGSGFRLPTVKELELLVDFTRGVGPSPRPMLDQTAFPGASAEAFWTSSDLGPNFWSSSPYAASSGEVWWVSFGGGGSGSEDLDHGFNWARCVR
jgi:hypothetical protein